MDIWVGYIQTSSFPDMITSNFHVWFCDLHWSINGAFCFVIDWGDIIAGDKRLGHYYFKLSKFPFRRLFNLLVISSGRKFVAEIVKGEQPSQEHLFCFIYRLVISKNWACKFLAFDLFSSHARHSNCQIVYAMFSFSFHAGTGSSHALLTHLKYLNYVLGNWRQVDYAAEESIIRGSPDYL